MVTREIYTAHVGAFARINKKLEVYNALFVVNFRNTGDPGKVVALVTQTLGQQFFGTGNTRLGKYLFSFGQQKTAQIFFRQDYITRQLNLANIVDLALTDIGGNVHRLFVRAYRDLGGIDIELDITPVQVKGAEFFEITLQFFARILVTAADPAKPAGGFQFKLGEQLFVGKSFIAHNVNVFD